ncbi:methionyl-tRNA formyltransferase [Spiroplasma sp. NBRC 100390]|uniref:methionyl-tRNA formyltransferase n=1 Tax=unclassified Spiroplasma TaxID=2637901 RepID=UPI0008928250|nr:MULTISPECIES: methionyl-tRNA formyltransferase [unclassified Spiroplasma]AOX44076.1 methionyl-tRNA formyltransferase [Spiroplasma sp. TU-14]APE13546.1 methionyl-tRNA formyltransferase [Spiroplasma sp. NBRC 100390]
MQKYKVIFMGTPVFATAVLTALTKLAPTIELIGIVTQPDRKIGRNQTVQFSPVKEFGLAHQIQIFQPEKINDLYSELEALQPDVIVTCAYGQFIPERILKLAKINCINAHGSLLPKLRGGAPIHKAIIYGEQETGITLMKMIKKMDAGEMYVQEALTIAADETASSLHDRLMILAGTMIEKHLLDIITGKLLGTPQDDSQATFAYNITRDEEKISWHLPKQNIYDQIRGLYAWPIAYTTVANVIYKIHQAVIATEPLAEKDADLVDGTIIAVLKTGIKVKVEDGYLIITRLQREGKKVTEAKNYYHTPSPEIIPGNILI